MSWLPVRVKICGITNLEDANFAVSFGADALGFIVGVRRKAEDAISPEEARRIILSLPPYISSVLVTDLMEAKRVIELCKEIGATTIQLQDEIPFDEIVLVRRGLPNIRLVKAVHVTGPQAVDKARGYEGRVDAILLDTLNIKEDRIGGTGLTHDWRISRRIRERCSLPVILAGGLNPENIEEAIRIVHPYGVDVNSGVENPEGGLHGRKDPVCVKAFIEKAKKFT